MVTTSITRSKCNRLGWDTVHGRFRSFGLATVLAAGLGVAGCATAPVQEFQAYSNAAEQVAQTTLQLLDDYEKAVSDLPQPDEVANTSVPSTVTSVNVV
jgi:hypothetical protein